MNLVLDETAGSSYHNESQKDLMDELDDALGDEDDDDSKLMMRWLRLLNVPNTNC